MKSILHPRTMLCVAVLLATGCGSSLNTAKVNGKVTVAGQPVADIVVTFMPEGGGRPAMGVTDASGNFSLSTLGNQDGAVPGKHKVAFSKSAPPPASDPSQVAPADYNPKPVELPFNAKYATAETSGITADVEAGKANNLPAWDLEK